MYNQESWQSVPSCNSPVNLTNSGLTEVDDRAMVTSALLVDTVTYLAQFLPAYAFTCLGRALAIKRRKLACLLLL